MSEGESTPRKTPPFAASFPRTPALDALVDAFERGDYARVREGTRALEKDESEAVRAAAKELRSRTEPDPFAKIALLLTLALLAWLTIHWETHDGQRNLEPDRPAAPPAQSSSP